MPELLPPSLIRYLPLWVRAELARLPAQQQDEFVYEYRRKLKSLPLAYLCWLAGGSHYLYLRRGWMQVFFWMTLGGMGLWWIIDGFRLPRLVHDYNADVGVDLLRTLRVLG